MWVGWLDFPTLYSYPRQCQSRHDAAALREILGCSQLRDLFDMVLSMHPVKFPPLAGRKRPEDWMVKHSGSGPVTGLALGNQPAHGGNLGTDLRHHLIRRHALWSGRFGRLSALGKVTQFCHQSDACSLL